MREKLILVRETPEIRERSVLVVSSKRMECSTFWGGIESPKRWRIKPSSDDVFRTVGLQIQDIILFPNRHWARGRVAAFIMADSKGGAK